MRFADRHSRWGLVAVAALCGLIALSPAPVLLRAPFAAVLVFWLPGTALMGAIFPARAKPFGGMPGGALEGSVLALCLSLAVTILCGLALNLLGLLKPTGWATGLVLLTTAFQGLAAKHSVAQAPHAMLTPRLLPLPANASGLCARLRPADLAMIGVSACLAVGAVMLARQGAQAQAEYRYTELWLVPAGTGPTAPATLGIRNAEQASAIYEIDILDSGRLIGRWPPVRLAPGETFTTTVAAGPVRKPPAGQAPAAQEATASRTLAMQASPATGEVEFAPLPERREPEGLNPVAGASGRRLEARLYLNGARDRIYRRAWMALSVNVPPARGAAK